LFARQYNQDHACEMATDWRRRLRISKHDRKDAIIAFLTQAEKCDISILSKHQHGRAMDIDIIRARMDSIGLKSKDLAEWIGISPDKVSKSLKGIRAFKADEVDRIREVLRLNPPADDDRPPRTIPVLGMVSAGRWKEAIALAGERMPLFDPGTPRNAFAVRVDGDSMDRVIEDGGTIIVDPDDRALYPKRYYIVRNGDGETTFKQYLEEPARLSPCSTNPAHQEIMVGEGSFEIVGRVIWRGSRM
jgi:SOS-response transcriptional repressor LexA